MNNKFLKIGIVIALAVAIGLVLSFKFRNQNSMKNSADKSEEKVEKASQTILPKLIDNQNSMETPADTPKVKVEKAPKTTLPKLVDLGAGKCIPCKMMEPILDELKREYAGKLDIVVIDVWENQFEDRRYGIRVIPTQIFYDANGKEFFRHEGFFSKEEILETFKDAGLL